MSAMLKEQFDQQGYVVLKRLFGEEEVKVLKEEAARILETRNGAQKGSGVFLGMTAASPKFKEAARHPRLVEVLKEVMSDKVIFLSDKLVYKTKKTAFGSPWHRVLQPFGGFGNRYIEGAGYACRQRGCDCFP